MDTYAVTNQGLLSLRYRLRDRCRVTGRLICFRQLLAEDAPLSQAVETVPWWRVIRGAKWNEPFGPGSNISKLSNCPVVHVSWNDAKAFAMGRWTITDRTRMGACSAWRFR